MSATKTRLDQHLVNLGLFNSRAQSAAAIKAQQVKVNGAPARKSLQMVSFSDEIIAAPAHGYVSRGGLKLEKALAHLLIR
jgi:23S rRNA (cytidine1920-2'-O)/16S rRNA (cytidine1409-2'-O)-methyltransferase